MSNTTFTYPRHQLRRSFFKILTAGAFKLLSRLEIIGRENIPAQGPLIVVGNHFNFADPAVFVHLLPWHAEYIAGTMRPTAPNLLVRKLPDLWGTINVHRDGASTEAIRKASVVLKNGGILGVFPEAGAWANVLRPARPGTAFLATTTHAPLLPIGIDGMDRLFPSVKQGQREKVTIRIGKPFGPFEISGRGKAKKQRLKEIGHEIMGEIAALLPPKQRGLYADDPILRAEAEKVADFPSEWGFH